MSITRSSRFFLARSCAFVLCLVGTALGTGFSAHADSSLVPLSESAKKILFSSPEDTPVKRFQHYVKTNENRHDLFYPFIRNIRGGYIGIASDQSYTLMAYARSEFAWLIDFDSVIQDIHWVHRGFILASSNAKDFLACWHKDNQSSSLALLNKTYKGHPKHADIMRAYRNFQSKLHSYLTERSKADPQTRSNWLNTHAHYSYIRLMHQTHRIRILYGNLIGPRTLVGIGEAARKVNIPIRVFYTSNAEEWISFKEAYSRNINALYVDEKSVMTRTLWIKLFQPRASDLWQYNIHKLQHFQKFLKKFPGWAGSLNRVMRLSHLWGTTLSGFPEDYVPSNAQ